MKLVIAIILFLQLQSLLRSQNLIERPSGYFITGRGCGTTNPIRYLNSIPKDLQNHQCSFIDLQNSVPSAEDVKVDKGISQLN